MSVTLAEQQNPQNLRALCVALVQEGLLHTELHRLVFVFAGDGPRNGSATTANLSLAP